MSALDPTTGSKPEKLRISKCFPVCPRKRTYLERLLPPVLRERRHRRLARRVELWCAAAPERQYLASLRSGLWDLLANDYAATYLDASFVAAISARR
jgi:hypothetical protein